MTHSLGICLWFDKQAKEAFTFYESVFTDIQLISENPFTVNYTLAGRRFMNLNGGPEFKINPSISFFYNAESEEEIDRIWAKLTGNGKIMMPLNTYPWSSKYGWVADRFGVNWQLMLDHEAGDKLYPSMMFTGDNNGKAAEAIEFYNAIFPDSKTVRLSPYGEGGADVATHLNYAQFELNNQTFGAMDSSHMHEFQFNEGVSHIVICDTQEEIDHYWNSLTTGGSEGKCGWLKDKYGVSWQIVPSLLGKYMNNPATAPKATYAFLQMSKFIIADLEKACEN
ncbi:MAG: hypothetical protein RL127_1769 [Bacteroidota bacterium]|jgi:predicted 3-demethylubiquinone-9 3-methyltransferase (glyoxalase superfamily)